jgi:polysaccharide deacetylase family protein (PEP-CTERM system associated)
MTSVAAVISAPGSSHRAQRGIDALRFSPVAGLRRDAGPVHAFTMDVEDWQQSVYDPSLPVSTRFIAGVTAAAAMLERRGARGTFFVLGNVARAAPGVLRTLHAAGHEIQIHGHDHTPVHRLGRRGFREDVLRAKGIVEDILGAPVTGYRAPRFSIDATTLWALDELAACGILYDSSVFPMRIRGYGIDGWPAGPHRVTTASGASILEAPVALGRCFGRPLPVGGGGYFRVLPRALLLNRLRALQDADQTIVLYCHPYEFDPQAFRELPLRIPLRQRLHQGIGRAGFAGKVEAVLDAIPVAPLGEVLGCTAAPRDAAIHGRQ